MRSRLTGCFDLFHRPFEPLSRAQDPKKNAVRDDDANSNDGVVERLRIDRLSKEFRFGLIELREILYIRLGQDKSNSYE